MHTRYPAIGTRLSESPAIIVDQVFAASDEVVVRALNDDVRTTLVVSRSQLLYDEATDQWSLDFSVEDLMQPAPAFVIGLTGPIGCGKDTFAKLLCNAMYPQRSAVYAFAQPLRHMAAQLLGTTPGKLTDQAVKQQVFEPWGVTYRDVLRALGTDLKASFGEDMWVKAAEHRLRAMTGCVVVIPDVRFEAEAAWVRERGVLIHINREDNPHQGQMSGHVSDAGVEPVSIDLLVNNNGTLDELKDAAEAVLRILT